MQNCASPVLVREARWLSTRCMLCARSACESSSDVWTSANTSASKIQPASAAIASHVRPSGVVARSSAKPKDNIALTQSHKLFANFLRRKASVQRSAATCSAVEVTKQQNYSNFLQSIDWLLTRLSFATVAEFSAQVRRGLVGVGGSGRAVVDQLSRTLGDVHAPAVHTGEYHEWN